VGHLLKSHPLHLSQFSDLAADAAEISVGYLSQIERNQTKLPIGVLKRISSTLGVHMNWFLHADDVPSHERDIVVRSHNRRRFTFTGIGIEE
ncbi:helix-turn-helix domain-containing protein, partial [Rhizobium ruizarguesonis]